MRTAFHHQDGEGMAVPIVGGGSVLVVSSKINLDHSAPDYDEQRIQRLKADAGRFADQNEIDDVEIAQGPVEALKA